MSRAISQALKILRDSVKDLWPLLRGDGLFYVPATVIMFALNYVILNWFPNYAHVPPDQRTSTIVTVAIVGAGYYLLSTVWVGVAACRSSERLGNVSTSRLRLVAQYCLVSILLAVYVLLAIVVAIFVVVVVALAIYFIAWTLGGRQFNSPDWASLPPPMGVGVILFYVGAMVFSAKLGAAPAIRILTEKSRPIATSWTLTNRFWRLSFVLGCAITVINYVPGWIVNTIGPFTPWKMIITLPYDLLTLTLFGRMYVQFAREMLDAPQPAPALES